MLTFPTMSSGSMRILQSPLKDQAMAMYPATVRRRWATRVVQFLGDQEQRWTLSPMLVAFEIEYRGVSGYDVSLVRDFFLQVGGRNLNPSLDNTFTMHLLGQDWNYLVLDQDDFTTQVDGTMTYSFKLRMRQVRRN